MCANICQQDGGRGRTQFMIMALWPFYIFTHHKRSRERGGFGARYEREVDRRRLPDQYNICITLEIRRLRIYADYPTLMTQFVV